ncbi:G-protein coupled receptor 52-like [Apostichopus japonicus]|uniref:G-protein coupled receptor 52-like n=1 Tax=Stichopus japonicus TaxID=307972 RepID=UPI003AB2E719
MNSTDSSPVLLYRSFGLIIAETVYISVATVLILLGNTETIVILNSPLSWEDNANLLLQNLALADFGVGLFLSSFAIYPSSIGLTYWPYGDAMCKLSSFLGASCCSVSILTLALISIERYFLIVKPLRYHSLVTKDRILLAIGLMWLSVFILFLPTFSDTLVGTVYNVDSFLCSVNFTEHRVFTMVTLCAIFLPANFVILYAYGTIFVTSHKHKRQIKAQREVTDPTPTPRRNNRAIQTFVIITGMFNLAWVPYSLLALSRAFLDADTIPHWVEFLLPWLAMSNSFVNVIIYIAFNPPFRKQLKKMVLRKLCYKQNWGQGS